LRETITDGDLPERQALLRSLLDHMVLVDRTAHLHYQSLWPSLSNIPPARFIIKGSTFEPLVVTF
jgi:hypothetical protein